MQRLARILNELPEEGRLRAVRYLIDRFGSKPVDDPKNWSMSRAGEA